MLKIDKILYEDKMYIREELETETLFDEKCKAIDLDGFTEKFFSVTGSLIREQDGKEYTEDIDRYPFCVVAGDHLKKRFRERFSGFNLNCVLDRIVEFFTQDIVIDTILSLQETENTSEITLRDDEWGCRFPIKIEKSSIYVKTVLFAGHQNRCHSSDIVLKVS